MLVLENEDIALASFDRIGELIPMLLAERKTAPDEIYLAETHTNPWLVWPMKHGTQHWQSAGVSEWKPTPFDNAGLNDLSTGRG